MDPGRLFKRYPAISKNGRMHQTNSIADRNLLIEPALPFIIDPGFVRVVNAVWHWLLKTKARKKTRYQNKTDRPVAPISINKSFWM
jgi:hypothetical protein